MRRWSSAAKGELVRGPLARMVIVSGSDLREGCDFFAADFEMLGCWAMSVGDAAENSARSTARAWPAGTAEASAACEEEGAGAAHLLLEEPGGGVFGFAFEGVGADKFGEVGGLVSLGGAEGAHLGEGDFTAEGGGLQGGFGTGEAAADDVDSFHCLRIGDWGGEDCDAL